MSKKQINTTRTLLKNNLIEEPSVNFTEELMKKITTQEKNKSIIYNPIISKKSFRIIILTVISLLIVLLSLPSSYFNSPYNSLLVKFSNIFTNLFSGIDFSFINKTPIIIPITIISGWILLFSDILINKIINKKVTTD
ncbi:MAG: hypothetical protein DRJ01_02740 [Bacteroidetes bacterium]|nr:MAG: hypothetical protein DRJ01_02740 [Bacteroidota bacterium]